MSSLHEVSHPNLDVTILMPCLNEAQTLRACIENAFQALSLLKAGKGLIGEVLIADNGSDDGSVQIAQEAGARIVHVAQRGYGSALIAGSQDAYGRYIVMGDADSSYDFIECIPMIDALQQGFALCMGSRFKGKILSGAMPWKNRYIGNPLLSGLLNLLFKSRLSDAHSGLRAYTRVAFNEMRLTSTGMEFASEMVIKATLLDLPRTEVPVTLRPDGRNRPPHLRPWRDGWRHLRYLFMLSPAWLYFIPSIAFGTIGGVIFILLVLNTNSLVIDVGPIWFGDHWLIISGALIVASHQATMFGLATSLYGIRAGYRRVQPWLVTLFRVVNLETTILIGLSTMLVGLVILSLVLLEW